MGVSVAVVGATGLVGSTVLTVLQEVRLPVGRLDAFATAKSQGKILPFNGYEVEVKELKSQSLKGYDLVFFCAGNAVSRRFVPFAERHCGVVIDNSSCFRRDDGIPLVVPEVNMCSTDYKGIIANPNCSTIQCALPLNALKKFGLRRVWFTTYQSVSGSGQKGISALKHALNGVNDGFYPCDISKNTLPCIGEMARDSYTAEEQKMAFETRKILGVSSLRVSATCVRVPIEFSHAVSVVAELDKEFSMSAIIAALGRQEGVALCDEPASLMQQRATGGDDVLVGRLRRDKCLENGVCLYCVADNLRRGAASNAVKIACRLFDGVRAV